MKKVKKVSENPMDELENKIISSQSEVNPVSNSSKPTNKKSWFVVAILLIAIVGTLWLISNNHKKTTPSTSQAKLTTAYINISSTGFVPSDINVPTNTLVTWTNKDTKPHEVAADPYPKDDSIPNFNNNVVLQPNETYTFKFENKGLYKYHDQLNPFKFNGMVKVK